MEYNLRVMTHGSFHSYTQVLYICNVLQKGGGGGIPLMSSHIWLECTFESYFSIIYKFFNLDNFVLSIPAVGHVQSIKFSYDRKILAIQRSLKIVVRGPIIRAV